jgi:hypothetical protein
MVEMRAPETVFDDESIGWNVIRIEGYCMKNAKFHQRASVNLLVWRDNSDGDSDPDSDPDIIPNPDYDPTATRPEFPEFCERRICYACLGNNCKYFAYGEPQVSDIEIREHAEYIILVKLDDAGLLPNVKKACAYVDHPISFVDERCRCGEYCIDDDGWCGEVIK